MFAKKTIDKRPPTYEPPEIKDDFAELPRPWQMFIGKNQFDVRMVTGIILIVGLVIAGFISLQGLPPKILLGDDEYVSDYQFVPADKDLGTILVESGFDKDEYGAKIIDFYFLDFYDMRKGTKYLALIDDGMSEKEAYNQSIREYLIFVNQPQNDPTKDVFWSGVILAIVFAASFFVYYRNIYKRNAQLKIMQMEEEFKEAMYVIASRMGENKPVENALKHAQKFLPGLIISKRIFGKTIENIELMGLPLDQAVFDPLYGSLKGIPSKTLKTAMQLLVDSVSLGVEVASRTLMSLSMQMENMDKVNRSLKVMVSDVTTTMTTMAVFIGPIVLGITVALQKVVMMTLSGVVADPAVTAAQGADFAGSAGGGAQLDSLFSLTIETFQQFATPLEFLIILSIYVVEIVIIMIYFTTRVQEDNVLLFRINLAKNLPIALTIFIVTALAANIVVGGMM